MSSTDILMSFAVYLIMIWGWGLILSTVLSEIRTIRKSRNNKGLRDTEL